MKTIDRYLLRSFLVPLVVSLGAFLVVAVVVDLFERLDTFLDNHVAWSLIFQYYAAKTLFLFVLILPIATLMGVLFSLGGMARRNELIAMTASGIPLLRIIRPILIAGLAVSFLAMAFALEAVPRANELSTDIYDHEIKGRPRPSGDVRHDLNYLGTDGRFFLMKKFDGIRKEMKDVVVQRFAEGTLVERIDARTAVWKDERWSFENGYFRRFLPDGRVQAERFTSWEIQGMRERPEDFLRPVKEPKEMPLIELIEHVKRAELSGGDVTRLQVEEHRRFAFPFANFLVILLGAPMTGAIRRGGHAVGFALSLLIGFVYYVLLEVGGSLGLTGTLPPIVAAWLPNAAFLGIGLAALAKTRK